MIIGLTLERGDEWGPWRTLGPPAASSVCVCVCALPLCEPLSWLERDAGGSVHICRYAKLCQWIWRVWKKDFFTVFATP